MKSRGRWVFHGVVVATLALLGAIIAPAHESERAFAASAANFDPGNIITDARFHDAGAMSVAQIQGFLNAQVPQCASGFVCLKDYRQDTWTRPADAQCRAYSGAAGESAATIIWKVSQACNLNPQVMLVVLQKEQALVTSTAPNESKYRKATGYACPDTPAGCDATYAGFYNQVYRGAWVYRYYENNPTSYRYQAKKVVNIQLHPNTGCGTKPVYIQNQATANLYIYTPYVPNAAALANLYGTGDACSSYGNRNFFRIFSDWFGSPSGPPNPHGALDYAVGVLGGIQISGWAVDPYISGSPYIWVSVDGAGSALRADRERPWIPALYPGFGTRHGFDSTIPATPGRHSICVQQVSGTVIGCSTVVVPASTRTAGHLDAVTASAGAVKVTGWSLDKLSSNPGYVWVTVDGVGGAHRTLVDLPWTATAYPGTGIKHGFEVQVSSPSGSRMVCVSSSGAESVLLGCQRVTVPTFEQGAIESATGVLGGVRVTGWSLDQRTASNTYVWAQVAGTGVPARANRPSVAARAAYPSVAGDHGFDVVVPAGPGPRTICVTGTAENKALGCRTVTVPNNEVGSFDALTSPSPKMLSISGWSLDQRSASSTYVWVSIDGVGRPLRADQSLPWINAMYGKGDRHGFSGSFAVSPGTHSVCVTGTSENVSYGCKTVEVASTVVGSADSVQGVPGGIAVSGWAVDRASTAQMYVWVDVDGRGSVVKADKTLPWINSYFPGVGNDHGYTATIPATPGPHRVCQTITTDRVSLGCTTVTVP